MFTTINNNARTFKRGEVYYADLRNTQGSEQGGVRPVLILQNDTGNFYSPAIIIIPLTSKVKREDLLTHYTLSKEKNKFLVDDSVACAEQIRAVDKSRFKNYIGTLNKADLRAITGIVFANLCGD